MDASVSVARLVAACRGALQAKEGMVWAMWEGGGNTPHMDWAVKAGGG